jgi:primosomal protein N'
VNTRKVASKIDNTMQEMKSRSSLKQRRKMDFLPRKSLSKVSNNIRDSMKTTYQKLMKKSIPKRIMRKKSTTKKNTTKKKNIMKKKNITMKKRKRRIMKIIRKRHIMMKRTQRITMNITMSIMKKIKRHIWSRSNKQPKKCIIS